MKVAVIGMGHIGIAIATGLHYLGNDVITLGKKSLDVTDRNAFEEHTLGREGSLDAVIYAVGHCPEGGFAAAVKEPLESCSPQELQREIGMHVVGPFNVYQEFLGTLKSGGCMVFISTAAVRLAKMKHNERPPGLYMSPYLSAMLSQNELVEGMRGSPTTRERNIRFHSLYPPGVRDSPFHKGNTRLQASVTTSQVVDEAIKVIRQQGHQDITWT